jgi:hypothetical protein
VDARTSPPWPGIARVALSAALVLASADPAAADSATPAICFETVFPPGQSVCAGVPPRHAEDVAARGEEEAIPSVDVVPRETLLEDALNGGGAGQGSWSDLRLLRWRSVSAHPLSEEMPLEIAQGVVGLTLRAEADDDDWNISVELLGPDGTLLACEDCPDAPAVGEVREGRGVTQMPSTDRPGWQLAPGEYSFRVRATPADSENVSGDGTTVAVLATLRTNASVEVEHRLDLNFVYLPHCNLSADIAQSSPRFAEFLGKVDLWLAPLGIQLGRVTHVDLHRTDFDVIATWAEAGEMFRTSAWLGRPRALNVYCVQAFEPPLNPVVGLAGGIPGPVKNGTRDSGIAIRTESFFTCSDCLDGFASLMAHEIGHYLGFYHTTEADLAHWDPILDTPECHDVALNDCPDHDYAMFPLIHLANTAWSASQDRIAPTAPIVRTVAVVGRREAPAPPPHAPLVAAPNPFAADVRFALDGPATPGRIVTIHDVAGRLVRRLDAEASDVLLWDGRDASGRATPGGIYFARVSADGRVAAVRLVKVR